MRRLAMAMSTIYGPTDRVGNNQLHRFGIKIRLTGGYGEHQLEFTQAGGARCRTKRHHPRPELAVSPLHVSCTLDFVNMRT